MGLKYSGCMRSHGITDFPDPTVDANGLPSWSMNVSGGLNPQSREYEAAHQACKNDLPSLGQSPADEAAANAKALKYAECMRSNGEFDFPDPNGQGLIQGSLDPSSPQYETAQQACRSLDGGFYEQFTSSAVDGGPGNAGSGSGGAGSGS
jgi:hypothetical protein